MPKAITTFQHEVLYLWPFMQPEENGFPLLPATGNLGEQWKRVEQLIAGRFEKVPDLQAVLFLIGMNEYGHPPKKENFTKEEKQDLMHIAVCTVLEPYGYFRFEGRDADGWPHWTPLKQVEVVGFMGQEVVLKRAVVAYFGVGE